VCFLSIAHFAFVRIKLMMMMIVHARQHHEVDWLQGRAVRALQFANSPVQFSSSAVNTA